MEKFPQAETELLEAISLTDGTHFCALSATYSFLSEARLGLGRFGEAREAARRGLALAQESENDLDLGTAWRALGRVNAADPLAGADAAKPGSANESPESADACFESSVRIFRKIGAAGDEAATLRYWAEFEHRRGREEDARSKANSALEIFRRLGASAEIARTEAAVS